MSTENVHALVLGSTAATHCCIVTLAGLQDET